MSTSRDDAATLKSTNPRRAAWQIGAVIFSFWLAEIALIALFVHVFLAGRTVSHPVALAWLVFATEAGACGIKVVVWSSWVGVALLVLRLSRRAALVICACVLSVTATIWIIRAISRGVAEYFWFGHTGFALIVVFCRIIVPLSICVVWTIALAKKAAIAHGGANAEA